jgi:Cu-Zn family superoxide dismutase
MMRRVGLAMASLGLLLAGCASMRREDRLPPDAVAQVRNAAGEVVGIATFTETGKGVRVVLDVRGLTPGEKGVHVHEVGRCEPPAFTTAGGHFNPDKKQHGTQNPAGSHAGDLPNVVVAPDGTGRLDATSNRFTLKPGPTSLFDADGSALVIHANADDYRTDPTGNSGSRLACGVIVPVPPSAK